MDHNRAGHVSTLFDSTCRSSSSLLMKYVGFILPGLKSFSAWSSKCFDLGSSLSPSGSSVQERGGLLSCTTCVEVCPLWPTQVLPSLERSKPIARGVARPGTEPPPTGQVPRPPSRPTRWTSPHFMSSRPHCLCSS